MRSRRKRSSAATTSPAKEQSLPFTEPASDPVCRVCMSWSSSSRTNRMIGLLEAEVQGMKLAELLALVGAVEICTVDDRLPKWCCSGCRKELERAFRLRLRCQDSDQKLRDVFESLGEIGVVKEEVFDGDQVNPLEEIGMECKPEEATVESGDIEEEPKTEETELQDAESVGEEAEAVQESSVMKKARIPTFPDVFDEVPAVGFRCCGCKNKFDTSKDLKAHSSEVHIEKKLSEEQLGKRSQCDICYKVLRNSHALEQHKSLVKRSFRCKVCGDVFRSRMKVCGHHNAAHSGPSKTCCACLKKFETQDQLKEHCLEVHLPEKPPPNPARPFSCRVCFRSYASEAHLYAHQSRTIMPPKKHMCVECGMLFRYPSLLRDHETTHTGERLYQCLHCPKTYSCKNSFRKHVDRHFKTKPEKHRCETCQIGYQSLSMLREHIAAKHTGERPHKCPHCPASYARLSSLKSHMFTHSVQKLHNCHICGKQFKRYSEVRTHVRFFHHKLKPYPCFFCPKEYPRKDYRKRHMVSAHPEELRNNPLPPLELYGNATWKSLKTTVDPPAEEPIANDRVVTG
ncbi:AAEL014659-PA [Aedes aegypti]|uniref:AAEL014659-PA n=1 Tax=Aedes aegypti TaxID=7159 RepID=Q16FS2_AEDAE|nr:AAEL014659-PA [Aedes aegypti]